MKKKMDQLPADEKKPMSGKLMKVISFNTNTIVLAPAAARTMQIRSSYGK